MKRDPAPLAAPSAAAIPRTAWVTLWFPKPSETFVVSEVRALRALGADIRVHTLYGPPSCGSASGEEPGVQVSRLGLASLPEIIFALLASLGARPWTTLGILGRVLASPGGGLEKYGENILAVLCSFALAQRLRAQDVEHVHAAWANGSATAAWAAARLLGIPFSTSARAGDVHPPDGLLGRKLAHAAFARVDSAYNLPHLRRLIPQHPAKVRLVYNARTLDPPGIEALAPVRMGAGDHAGRPVEIAAIGRLVMTKGFQHLIEALALLRDRGLNARLTLAGDGPWRGRLARSVERLGLTEQVRMPGFLPHAQVALLLRGSDMLVMPSVRRPSGDSDGLPTVIVEALLCGVPVVATDVASIPDLVRHGDTGLLAPEADPEALADAISRLVADPAAARDMALRGRSQALTLFDPQACAHHLAALLTGELSAGLDGPPANGTQGGGPCAE